MKILKKIHLIIILAVITFIFLSCGTTVNIFDESIPPEDSVALRIEPSITIKSYNGINVNLKTAFLGMGATGFTIPAGDTSFIVDLEIVINNNAITGSRTILKVRNVEMSYKFEGGKEYLLRCWYTDEDGKVAVSNIGRGLRMSLIICEGGFYNAIYIKKLGN